MLMIRLRPDQGTPRPVKHEWVCPVLGVIARRTDPTFWRGNETPLDMVVSRPGAQLESTTIAGERVHGSRSLEVIQGFHLLLGPHNPAHQPSSDTRLMRRTSEVHRGAIPGGRGVRKERLPAAVAFCHAAYRRAVRRNMNWERPTSLPSGTPSETTSQRRIMV